MSNNDRAGTPETSLRLAVLGFHKIGAPPGEIEHLVLHFRKDLRKLLTLAAEKLVAGA